jgi:hypothetical protein
MTKFYLTLVLTLTCQFGLGESARARDNQHSVKISGVVQIGDTNLKLGYYKLEWQGAGPAAQVSKIWVGETPTRQPARRRRYEIRTFQSQITNVTAEEPFPALSSPRLQYKL